MPYCYDKGCDTKVYLWIQNLNKNNIHKCRDHGWEEEKVVLLNKTRKSLVRFQVRLIWKTTSWSHHFTCANSFFFWQIKVCFVDLKKTMLSIQVQIRLINGCCQNTCNYSWSSSLGPGPPKAPGKNSFSISGKVTKILTTPSSYFIMGLPPPIALEFLDMVIGGSCGVGGGW